jgi:hypothetical protein
MRKKVLNKIRILGFYPKPHFIFWLEPKNEAKKFKIAPASLEKLAFSWLKPSKLAPTIAQTGQFQTPTSLVCRLTGRGRLFADCVQYRIVSPLQLNTL